MGHTNTVLLKAVLLSLTITVKVSLIAGLPLTGNEGNFANVSCPRVDTGCRFFPEKTCDDDAQCATNWPGRVGKCCPHACKPLKTCKEIRVPTAKPSTTKEFTEVTTTKQPTTVPTTSEPTTTKFIKTTTTSEPTTTQPSTVRTKTTTASTTTRTPTVRTKKTTEPTTTPAPTIRTSETTEPTTTPVPTVRTRKTTEPTTTPVPTIRTRETTEPTTTPAPTIRTRETTEPTTTPVPTVRTRETTEPTTTPVPTVRTRKTTEPTTTPLPPIRTKKTTEPTTTQTPTVRTRKTTEPTTTRASTTTKRIKATVTTPRTEKPEEPVCSRSDRKDILFIFDRTVNPRQNGQGREFDLGQVEKFLKQVVSELKHEKFNIGIMQYGGRRKPEIVTDFKRGDDKDNLRYGIENLSPDWRYANNRRTGEALAFAGNMFYEINSLSQPRNAQDIIVLLTRGRPSDQEQTKAELDMLKRRRVRVITIGLGSYPKFLSKYLKGMASFPDDLLLTSYRNLMDRKEEVLEKICLPLKLPASPPLCRNQRYDIEFLFDGSTSIEFRTYQLKKKFIRDVLFLLGPSDMNVGMMQFSRIELTGQLLKLGKHSMEEELKVVTEMKYHAGTKTMLGDALSRVDNEVFTGLGGDRVGVENVLVFFNDGTAHDMKIAAKEAENLKNRKVRVIGLSVETGDRFPETLKKLVSAPKYGIAVKLDNSAFFAKKLVSLICNSGK